jgi:hypothetical protein
MMGPSTVLNDLKCGSGAHRPTRISQNLLPKEMMYEAYSNLPAPPRTVNDMVDLAGLGSWHMPQGEASASTTNPLSTLPRFGTRSKHQPQTTSPHATTSGLLMKNGALKSPSPEVREILMRFTSGDTEAEGLSPGQ